MAKITDEVSISVTPVRLESRSAFADLIGSLPPGSKLTIEIAPLARKEEHLTFRAEQEMNPDSRGQPHPFGRLLTREEVSSLLGGYPDK